MWRKKKYLDFRLFKAIITVCLLFTWILRFRPLFPEKWKAKQLYKSLFLGFYIFWGFDTFVSTLACYRIKKNMCTVNTFRELLNFLFSEVYCFSSCHERETKRKFWVPMRNRTSDLQIPRSDALPLSHRDSTMSEVYCEVHITRVLHTARISKIDPVMFVNRIRDKVRFLSSAKK